MYSLIFATSKDILGAYLIIIGSCLLLHPVTMFLVSALKGAKQRW
ncbi:hypothetical protein JCM12214_16240 [Geobacillus vulcani]|uniref:Uncharacterized protein n=1 Tax=Geobacillus thermopakistaniensis (strain MAS1) TaxID=1408282 RepID=A0A7U9J879_GEOTM|nr:hypothetical protein [Geobacillus sp. MAS1]ESU70601.1 hypothetical protein T260_18315 [Geobacillus sp. MAS1]